eukprot:4097981-Pyramimonas_sp.AAC.1
MGSGVPVYMATASVSIQWWMCHYSFSLAPQVACTTGNRLLVGRVLHSAEPRTLQSAEARTLRLGCWLLHSVMVL